MRDTSPVRVPPPVSVVGPATHHQYIPVSLNDAGTRTTGVIRCDQPRVLDLAARNGKRLETVPASIIDEALARLTAILA